MMWSQTLSVMSVVLVLLAGAGWIMSVPEPEREPMALEEPEPVDPGVLHPRIPDPVPLPVPDDAPEEVLDRLDEPVEWCAAADAWPRIGALVRETGAVSDEVDDDELAGLLADVEPCAVVQAVSEMGRCSGEDECVGLLEWLHEVLGRLTNATGPTVATVTEDVAVAPMLVEPVALDDVVVSDPVVVAGAAVGWHVSDVGAGSASAGLTKDDEPSDVDEMSWGGLEAGVEGPVLAPLF